MPLLQIFVSFTIEKLHQSTHIWNHHPKVKRRKKAIWRHRHWNKHLFRVPPHKSLLSILGEYTLFISNIFINNTRRLELMKNQAKTKQHSETELLLFENYLLSSSILSFKSEACNTWSFSSFFKWHFLNGKWKMTKKNVN